MIEFSDASEFVKHFEKIHKRRVLRIPYTTKDGLRRTLLMCKCGNRFISLPYMSIGVMENKIADRKLAPFMLFETEEGNVISTSKKAWEIRDTLAHNHYIYADKLFIWMNLLDKDDVMSLYNSNIRRKIRKASKEGITIQHGNSKRLLNDFYSVYTIRMKEISVPPMSKRTISTAVKLGVTTIFVAYKDGKAIGGGTLNKTTDDIFCNELFATLGSYNKYYTSYILHYKMMKFSKLSGAVYYSFGRCTRNSSVHNYKKHWPGEEISLYWSYSKRTKNIRDNKFLYNLWAKLPYSLTKIIGPIVSKYVY